jgi:hypothetical protein
MQQHHAEQGAMMTCSPWPEALRAQLTQACRVKQAYKCSRSCLQSCKVVHTLLPAAAALFERTSGGRVPSKETKTYLGAGLAVLGVNLVRTLLLNGLIASLQPLLSSAVCSALHRLCPVRQALLPVLAHRCCSCSSAAMLPLIICR